MQLAQTRQKIDGFGINNTWATAMTDADVQAMFGSNGLAFSILRVGLGPDGQPMSANIPGDITKVKAISGVKLIGSCWSPPATCKSNNDVNDGGHVKTTCYDSWSTTITSFAKNNSLYAMSIGNEPDFRRAAGRAVQRQLPDDALHRQRDGRVHQGRGAEAEGAGDQGHRARGLGVDPQLVEQLGRRFGAG